MEFCRANNKVSEDMDESFVLAYDHSPLNIEDETDDAIDKFERC